ncbi:MAG: cation-translocating P-type ATPase [Proteobacteria bacterium]|nr:cation-translocating P-type ATPase [Pseudomonadota bacterium]
MNLEVTTPWAKPASEVLEVLKTSLTEGLSSNQAQERLEVYGYNVLKSEEKITPLARFLLQLKSPVVITLLVATAVSALVGDIVDAIAIFTIVIINAIIGYVQEAKADTAVEALKKLSTPLARVIREGSIQEVSAADVCLGDILVFEAGDYVPADCRVIQANQLSADEAILTGESLPTNKESFPVAKTTLLGERKNMLFAGTAITTGTARAVVTATGMNTEMGQIAEMLESTEVGKTPLQGRLEQITNRLLIFCLLVVILVAILGVIHGEIWLDVLMTAVSLAVAAIPEGLPTVVTLALVLGIQRMAKRNALVRRLSAVETLGSTNVICTDKTGTLTTGKMRVREVFTLSRGIVKEEDVTVSHEELRKLTESVVLCSNASLNSDGLATGDPTEVALLYLANNNGLETRHLNAVYPRLAEWSFDSNRKRMSVAVQAGSEIVIHCKGAPECILPLCQLSEKDKAMILQGVETLSSQGRRLLSVAVKILPESLQGFNVEHYKEHASVENNLTFLGLVSIADPPRQESILAIQECKAAGVKVVMITGDHPVTAKAIARELGIVEDGKFDQVMTGNELEKISAQDLERQIEKIAVYARVSPEHKLKIVQAWLSKGNIVAMTGDGVNDAPALKQASIGVSMGRGGTEVARQASAMILTDDNFATIVSAVEEGRAIYGNIRRTMQYLLSGNMAEILTVLGAALMGWPTPLAPIQLLWINLVTDGLPSLALAMEPVPKNILKVTKKPSPKTFFDRSFYRETAFVGTITSVMTLAIYAYMLRTAGEAMAKTYVFSFLVFSELFRSFACRSDRLTAFQMGLTSNLFHLIAVAIPIAFQIFLHHFDLFRAVFKVEMIDWRDCLTLIVLTLIPVTIIELKKWFVQITKNK